MGDPITLTRYAAQRLLKEFAKRMGLDDQMADVAAQVHMQQSFIPRRWDTFINANCARCKKEPTSCDYLNPTEKNITEGATVESTKAAVALMIETMRLQTCPALQLQEQT